MQQNEATKKLFAAVRGKDTAGIEKAVADGAQVNTRAPSLEQKTPLHFASIMGSADIVRLLAKLGADVNVADSAGETPLSVAAFRGRTDCVRALLDLKANPNTRSKAGWTPLMAAASEGHAEIVRMLLAAGAERSQKAREAAARHGHAEIAGIIR